MWRYLALVVDFDGTIASDGVVEPETSAALSRVRQQGRHVLRVTGLVFVRQHQA
jgi:hydroxymethylpyrimidine pyrophosphatase-like HAD family hydrolase